MNRLSAHSVVQILDGFLRSRWTRRSQCLRSISPSDSCRRWRIRRSIRSLSLLNSHPCCLRCTSRIHAAVNSSLKVPRCIGSLFSFVQFACHLLLPRCQQTPMYLLLQPACLCRFLFWPLCVAGCRLLGTLFKPSRSIWSTVHPSGMSIPANSHTTLCNCSNLCEPDGLRPAWNVYFRRIRTKSTDLGNQSARVEPQHIAPASMQCIGTGGLIVVKWMLNTRLLIHCESPRVIKWVICAA